MKFAIKIYDINFIKYLVVFLIKLFKLIFTVSTLTFISYFILEYFKIGLISNYFDMNYLLVVSIISGLFTLLLEKASGLIRPRRGYLSNTFPRGVRIREKALDLFVLSAVSLFSGLFCYQYLQNLGKMRYLIPPLVIIIIFVTGLICRNEEADLID